jgi:hypothetical protein
MVYQLRLIMSNQKARDCYRWLTGCRSLGFAALCFDGGGSKFEVESVVDPEPDDESDDVSEEDDEEEEDEDDDEDDEEEEEEDEAVESERFLFLSTAG